jgi:probable selenium-dependent hydroxylase accessory protein YqeC
MTATLQLIDLLAARRGIVCVVGAGGKKSIIYQLAREHPGRVAVTTTVHMSEVPEDLAMHRIIDDDAALLDRVCAAEQFRQVAFAQPSHKPGRMAGATAATIVSAHERGAFDTTFVKADGARMRWIKAPGPGEPLIIPGTDTVIPVLSARAIGEPLNERIAHRVEHVEAVTGIRRGQPLAAEAVGRLLASEDGALRGTGSAHVAPVINMVDNERQEELARAAATAALAQTTRFDHVVLCCLRRPSAPVVAVVTR